MSTPDIDAAFSSLMDAVFSAAMTGGDMPTLTAVQRRALPDSSFAYIDSEGNRHLPVHDEAHVRAAMSRWSQTAFESADAKAAARRKIRAAAQRFGIDPASFSDDVTTPAEFTDALDAEGDTVVRIGKLFECGDYPDKAFTFDAADLENAVTSFAPVPVDLEHTPTVLEGKLGSVQRIYADGTSLMGEVHLPAWLDAVLEDGSRKVSATWDRATKRLTGLALVRNPRVSDAALMAAFSAAQPPAETTSHHRSRRMNIREWLTGKAQEDGVELDDVEAAFADNSGQVSALEAEVARLKAEQQAATAQFAADKRHADAVTFANGLVDSHRLTPGAAEALVPLVARVFAADATATFADGEATGVALLQAFVATLPDLSVFTTQQVQGTAAFAAGQGTTTPGVDGKPAPMSEERIKELLSLTPLGRELSNGASH